jgi:hypothetical protein
LGRYISILELPSAGLMKSLAVLIGCLVKPMIAPVCEGVGVGIGDDGIRDDGIGVD